MDYQPCEGAMLIRRNCPICDCFYQSFVFLDKCPGCGHPYEKTEDDARKEEWNKQFDAYWRFKEVWDRDA